MSGGAYEYVMGNNNRMVGSSEITMIYSDFFANSSWNKYYDLYTNSSTSDVAYTNRILGDATGEMGPFSQTHLSSWYSDFGFFVINSYPWFRRGGNALNTSNAGAFNYNKDTGANGNSSSFSFRVALAPNI